MDDLKQLKIVKNIYIIMSLLFCALGIFLMAKPKSSVRMLCVLMGTMLILYGAIKISGYFTRDAFCLAFQFDLAFGILLMAVGVIMIARKNFAVDLIFSVFGILILADARRCKKIWSCTMVADPGGGPGDRSDRGSGFYQTI